MKQIEILVGEEDNERLDYYLSIELDDVSRNFVQKLIKDGNVLVNGTVKKASYKVKQGETLLASIPEAEPLKLIPQNIPLNIVYQDESLAVINKPQGMVVHPAPGNYDGTLVNALLYHLDNLSSINGVIRPGIVHRLDKDTSGLLVVAKNDLAHRILSDNLKRHEITREYIALLNGKLKEDKGTLNFPIGRDPRNRKKMAVVTQNGKEAVTHYEVIKQYERYVLTQIRLETGRTHQIRVHFSNIGHPVVGDPLYSTGTNEFGALQLLHAAKIAFIHPITGIQMQFEAELPVEFQNVVNRLNKMEV
ncbi:MAG: RluA family pseudouridine synthase [Gudongella sp.]|jgi:23S rRNA pseudouridine1911/1915/1917 synthase|nr:RluA family pseudouridine synthase [Gudongella sp.]